MAKRKRERNETLGDLIGQTYDEERPESDESLSEGDFATMERGLRGLLDDGNRQAADMGIKNKPWFHDDTAAEYNNYSGGLPDEILRSEYDKGMRVIRSVSSKDLDDTFERHGMADDLYDDFVQAGYDGYEPNEVTAAAQRVIARYRAQGTKNIERRVFETGREAFLDDVSTELVVGNYGSGESGGGRRTQGLGYGGRGGRTGDGWGQRESEDHEPISSVIADWQRKTGY